MFDAASIHSDRLRPTVGSLGLSVALYWRAIAFLYVFFGLLIAGASWIAVTDPDVTVALRAAGLASVALAPVWLLGARREIGVRWIHVPVAGGELIVATGQLFTGDLRGALLLTFIMPPTIAAMTLDGRDAAPHVLIGGLLAVAFGLTADVRQPTVYAVVAAAVTFAAPAMLIAVQGHARKMVKRNLELSRIDPLTGAANLRRLREHITDELARTSRTGSRFALIAIDLDDFKRVNGRYGYAMGDRMLIAVERALEQQLTDIDLVARRGGDEFMVVAPEIPGRDLDGLCRELAAAIATARAGLCPDLDPRASVASVAPRGDDGVRSLLERGDAALLGARLETRGVTNDGPGDRATWTPRYLPAGGDGRPAAIQPDPPAGAVGAKHAAAGPAPADFAAQGPASAESNRLRWRIGALLLAGSGATLIALGVISDSDDLSTTPILIAGGAAVALAPACLALARLGVKAKLMAHAILISSVGIVSVVSLGADEISASMLDLHLLLIFSVFYFLPTREALPYMAANLALYAWLLAPASFPYAEVRLVWNSAIVIVLALLFALARRTMHAHNRRNELLAQIDPLTGVANRRALMQRLETEVRRCELFGGKLCLVMIDLDAFKRVNDRHSHTVGDQVLRATADAIKHTIRDGELVARRGGDEFAVAVIDCDPEVLTAFKERVGAAISAARSAICPDLPPTAGIACTPWRAGDSADEFLRRADDALRAEKAGGRMPARSET